MKDLDTSALPKGERRPCDLTKWAWIGAIGLVIVNFVLWVMI